MFGRVRNIEGGEAVLRERTRLDVLDANVSRVHRLGRKKDEAERGIARHERDEQDGYRVPGHVGFASTLAAEVGDSHL